MEQNSLPHKHNAFNKEILENIPDDEGFGIISDIFKLLSDRSRIRIFWLLCHCEECVTNISAMVNMSSPAVSHHLKVLRDNGLITSRREGKEVYYKKKDCEQADLLHIMIEKIDKISCPDK